MHPPGSSLGMRILPRIRPGLLSICFVVAYGTPWTGIHATAIENETLRVKWERASSTISVITKPTGRVFLKNVRLTGTGGQPGITDVSHTVFGKGNALVVSYSEGGTDTIQLFPGVPFVFFRACLENAGAKAAVTNRVTTFAGEVELDKPKKALRAFGTGGLVDLGKNPGSYAWLAVVEPKSRNGVVFGWLTHDRGSGVLFTGRAGDSVSVTARVDYGKLFLPPCGSVQLETLAVGYFDDARLGLEAWAEIVARIYRIQLPDQPVGYCSWYSRPYGRAADEKRIIELAEFAAANLAPYGFSVVQIDDGWQAGFSTNGPKRNFTTHNLQGPYPGGMKPVAARISALGLTPGLWFMPFAGTHYDPWFSEHKEWFVKDEAGRPYETAWGGTCLDMTHPGARLYVSNLTSRICRDWGYRYIKIDGLWTGTATKQQYINAGYKEDNMGDAAFYDSTKSNIEVYRAGLRLVREAAGADVFILGCNGPQNMRSYGGAIGLVDAMRIGPDNGPEWTRLLRGPIFGSRHYFLHGRVWYNDPDPVYVRTNVPLNHARLICSWVALSGQMYTVSEWLPGLPPERLEILRRTMPYHKAVGRPVDLFEREPPRIWTLESPERFVLGLFNWDPNEELFDVSIDELGLDVATEYLVFDFWEDKLMAPVKERLQVAVQGESCKVLAMRPSKLRPQVISTSRHVTQGMIDLSEEHWDAAAGELRGRSRIVANDPYEVRVVPGSTLSVWALEGVRLSPQDASAGVRAHYTTDAQLIRVKLESAVSREVQWSVKFRQLRCS